MACQLVFVDPFSGGHHLALYGRYFFREAVSRDWRVHFVTHPVTQRHPLFAELCRELGHLFNPVFYPLPKEPKGTGVLRQFLRQRTYWRAYRDAYQSICSSIDADHVLIGNMEDLDNAIAIFGSPFPGIRFSGIHPVVRFHFKSLGVSNQPVKARRLQRRLFLRLLKQHSLARLFTLDPLLPEFARSLSARNGTKVVYVPDFAADSKRADRTAARRLFGVPNDAVVILTFGCISERKSVRELLEALAHASMPTEAIALLVGVHDQEARRILEYPCARILREQHRLLSVDHFASDEEEAAAYAAADYAWCVYKNFDRSSGVVMQAAHNGVPVIAAAQGLIALLVDQGRIGYVIETSTQEAITAELRNIIAGAANPLSESSFERFAAQHTAKNFSTTVCDAIISSR